MVCAIECDIHWLRIHAVMEVNLKNIDEVVATGIMKGIAEVSTAASRNNVVNVVQKCARPHTLACQLQVVGSMNSGRAQDFVNGKVTVENLRGERDRRVAGASFCVSVCCICRVGKKYLLAMLQTKRAAESRQAFCQCSRQEPAVDPLPAVLRCQPGREGPRLATCVARLPLPAALLQCDTKCVVAASESCSLFAGSVAIPPTASPTPSLLIAANRECAIGGAMEGGDSGDIPAAQPSQQSCDLEEERTGAEDFARRKLVDT